MKLKNWIKTMGFWGILFFLIKGLLWLSIPALIALFADYSARVEVVYVEPPLPVILQQNERSSKPVPRQVIRHLVEKLEPPTWAEAHSLFLVG